VEHLVSTADFDTRMLLASRPNPAAVEAAAKAADAAAAPQGKARRPQGKAPKGLAGPKGLAPKGLGGSGGGGETAAAAAAAAAAPAALPASLAAARAAFAADHLAVAQASAMRPLLQGLVRMLAGLEAAGVLAPPPLPFNSARERFEQRFGSFHILTRPEPLAYDQFEAEAGPGSAPAAVALQAAAALLGKVRRPVIRAGQARLQAGRARGAGSGGRPPALAACCLDDGPGSCVQPSPSSADRGLAPHLPPHLRPPRFRPPLRSRRSRSSRRPTTPRRRSRPRPSSRGSAPCSSASRSKTGWPASSPSARRPEAPRSSWRSSSRTSTFPWQCCAAKRHEAKKRGPAVTTTCPDLRGRSTGREGDTAE
jgi:hypothetical protein